MSDIIQENKRWFIGAGIILILIGGVAIALPLVTALAIEVLFGWIFIISGIVTSVQSFRAFTSGKCLLRLFIGILYLAIGVMFLVYPMQGVLTLTLLLAILFMFEGVVKISIAVRHRMVLNWGWMLASGIAALVLSGVIWAGWPGSAAWVLGLLVGLNLMFGGWTMLMLSTVPSGQLASK
ncbi:HdeD family acid-resistance protein [Candidatus Omnitrophota bacterium]